MSNAALEAWRDDSRNADAQVQEQLQKAAKSGSNDAWAALALVRLQNGTSAASAAGELEWLGNPVQRDEAFLEACGQIRTPGNGTAVEVVLDNLQVFPELARSSIVIPELRRAADASEIGAQAFARKYPRPQILEAVQAPLTWIHGVRVGVWSFSERPEYFTFLPAEPQRLVVTGKGPDRVSSLVSAIVNDLASERNCPSDLVLVGFAQLDLKDPGSKDNGPEAWTVDQFCEAVTNLAKKEGASEAIGGAGLGYIRTLAPRVLRHTVRMAKEAFQRVDQESGFVSNLEIELQSLALAEGGLSDVSATGPVESMPVLAEYKVRGAPLEVELNVAGLGNEPYARVVKEYKGSVRRQRVAEWERRLGLYEDWGRGAINQWRTLRMMNAKALEAYSTTIGWEVNFETATQVPLDPPRRIDGAQRLQSLPAFIVDNLAWWALAKYRIEAVSRQIDFHPWMDSYLIDAFLRGQLLQHEERGLQRAYEKWQQDWRPLALNALDGALRNWGLSLLDIATEQTVFRVMKKTPEKVVLRILHVWDPSVDEAPGISAGGATLFRPRFARRAATFLPGKSAQKMANQMLQDALAATRVDGPDLVASLALDSGGAIDRFMDTMAEPLHKNGIAGDMEKAANEAVHLDPFLRFGFSRKMQALKFVSQYVPLAQEFGQERKKAGAVPDFLAWEIYLVALAVKEHIETLNGFQDHVSDLVLGSIWRRSEPLNSGLESILNLKGWSAWQIAAAAGSLGPVTEVVSAMLANCGRTYSAEFLGDLVTLLKTKYPAYAEQCFLSEHGPPRSKELNERSVPDCLNGWTLVSFFLALGDAAAQLAHMLIPGGQGLDRALLMTLIAQLEARHMHDAFPDLQRSLASLVEELKKYLGANDVVSIEYASSKIRSVVAGLTTEAAAAYQAAAVRDGRYGIAWLRLAGLKWSLGQYREGLSILAGPHPAPDLRAAQLPLALAVRLARGSLTFSIAKLDGNWKSPAGTLLSIQGPDHSGTLTVEFTGSQYPNPKLGKCLISGLTGDDAQLLVDFMRKYEPDLLRSAGRHTLEDWFSLVQVPSWGRRGSIAKAIKEDAEFATLAAGVCLGTPPAMQFPERSASPPRLQAWLDADVVNSLEW